MSAYRQVRVCIYPGKTTTLVAVIARTHRDGRSNDALVHRSVVPHVDASTVAALLRVAGDECHDAADRLI